jgi:PAS domain-containing protein
LRQDALNRRGAAAQGSAEVVAAPADLIRVFEETQAMIRGMDGRILYWSRGSERLYGWSRESALGAISHELLKSKFPASLSEIEAALGRNGLWSGELRHRHKDDRNPLRQEAPYAMPVPSRASGFVQSAA